jgi:hypothetical protein
MFIQSRSSHRIITIADLINLQDAIPAIDHLSDCLGICINCNSNVAIFHTMDKDPMARVLQIIPQRGRPFLTALSYLMSHPHALRRDSKPALCRVIMMV